eukprot:12093235-Karenia_brevis.AAC.1
MADRAALFKRLEESAAPSTSLGGLSSSFFTFFLIIVLVTKYSFRRRNECSVITILLDSDEVVVHDVVVDHAVSAASPLGLAATSCTALVANGISGSASAAGSGTETPTRGAPM